MPPRSTPTKPGSPSNRKFFNLPVSIWPHLTKTTLRGLATIATVFVFFLLLQESFPVPLVLWHGHTLLVVIISSGSVALLAWVAFIAHWSVTLTTPSSTALVFTGPVDWEEIRAISETWDHSLTVDQRVLALSLITEPRKHIRRITERVRFEGRSIAVSTAQNIHMPRTFSSSTAIVPAHFSRRGRLVDGLRIEDSEGKRLSSLTQDESIGLLFSLANALIEATKLVPKKSGEVRDASTEEKESLTRFARSILGNNDHLAGIATFLAFRRWKQQFEGNSYGLTALELLLGRVSEQYPVFVLIDARTTADPKPSTASEDSSKTSSSEGPLLSPQIRFSTRRLELPTIRNRTKPRREIGAGRGQRFGAGDYSLKAIHTRFTRMGSSLKNMIGVYQSNIMFALDNADRATSYHLEVDGPPGMYMSDFQITGKEDGQAFFPSKATVSQTNVRGRHAQSFAHFYSKSSYGLGQYYSVVSFREMAPGSIADSLIGSGIVALLLYFVYAARGTTSNEFLSLLLPLLLAGIGTGSIWQGLIYVREPFGGRAVSRISSVITLGLCIYAIIQSGIEIGACASAPTGTCTSWNPTVWLVLCTLATTHFVVILTSWLVDRIVEGTFLISGERRGRQLP